MRPPTGEHLVRPPLWGGTEPLLSRALEGVTLTLDSSLRHCESVSPCAQHPCKATPHLPPCGPQAKASVLVWVYPEEEPGTRTWVQMVELGGSPKTRREGTGSLRGREDVTETTAGDSALPRRPQGVSPIICMRCRKTRQSVGL